MELNCVNVWINWNTFEEALTVACNKWLARITNKICGYKKQKRIKHTHVNKKKSVYLHLIKNQCLFMMTLNENSFSIWNRYQSICVMSYLFSKRQHITSKLSEYKQQNFSVFCIYEHKSKTQIKIYKQNTKSNYIENDVLFILPFINWIQTKQPIILSIF